MTYRPGMGRVPPGKPTYTVYAHVLDDETRAEVERIGIRAWLMKHPEAEEWRLEFLRSRGPA